MQEIKYTDLILNGDGSIYHLDLLPGDVATNIILVGDPGRVPLISSLFDHLEVKKQKREFTTHTGWYGGQKFSVISTGIGTGNIDIVMNELDALFNIDLDTLLPKERLESLKITRIGTCGTLQADIDAGTPVFSRYTIGLDNLMHFYNYRHYTEEDTLHDALVSHLPAGLDFYLVGADTQRAEQFSEAFMSGITVVAPGFYAPQQRRLRAPLKYPDFLDNLSSFTWHDLRILNLEMEASALYGLCRSLGHSCCTVDLILANRIKQQFLSDYEPAMLNLAGEVLDLMCDNAV